MCFVFVLKVWIDKGMWPNSSSEDSDDEHSGRLPSSISSNVTCCRLTLASSSSHLEEHSPHQTKILNTRNNM